MRRVIVWAALLAACPVRAEQPAAYFGIPVVTAVESVRDLGADEPLRVALQSRDAARLQQLLASRGGRLDGEGRVEVVLGPYVAAPVAQERDWLAATFFIDYEDAPIPELVRPLRSRVPQAQPADVVEFVRQHVAGTYDRGIDIASRVARDRRGDCTEYAALTTAVARSLGLPARVVFGVALTVRDGQVEAYGHAWAEIHADGRWQVADAALLPIATSVRYVPLGALDDEGPGYVMGVMQLTPAWITRVYVPAAAPQ